LFLAHGGNRARSQRRKNEMTEATATMADTMHPVMAAAKNHPATMADLARVMGVTGEAVAEVATDHG
jgi:hypothetical protein